MTCKLGWPIVAAVVLIAACSAVTSRVVVGEEANKPILTRWAHDAPTQGDPFYQMAYPRPRLIRADGIVLNGLWDFTTAKSRDVADAPPTAYPGKVLVPFPTGSPLSRVSRPGVAEQIWYRRTITLPQHWDVPHRHAILHLNGIDGGAVLYFNGKQAAGPADGGPMDVDVTDSLQKGPQAIQEIAVAVIGNGITPFDGIWQTVWIELLPIEHVETLDIAPDLDGGNVAVIAHCTGDPATQQIEVTAYDAGALVAQAVGKPGERITLHIATPKPWSPEFPFLYDLRVQVTRGKQKLDEAASYFGMRKIAVGKDDKAVPRILLNGKFEFQAGVMDAGRWPDGGATAPSEKGLRTDLEAVKQLGFNMIRKVGKIEPDFWYYQCDRFGILVWQDVANGTAGDKVDDAVRENELHRLVGERGQHPSIVAWVVGGKGASKSQAARDVKILKTIDPGRLVIADAGTPGAEEIGDVDDVGAAALAERPRTRAGRPSVVGDFGSFPLNMSGHSLGAHKEAADTASLTAQFVGLWEKVNYLKEHATISAAVYRELTDVGDRDGGLLTADRAAFKIDLESLSASAAAASLPLNPRIKVALPTGRFDPRDWLYTEKLSDGWNRFECETSAWKTDAPFHNHPEDAGGREAVSRTQWTDEEKWIRRDFTLGVAKMSNPWLIIRRTGEVEVFINGSLVANLNASDAVPEYVELLLGESAKTALRAGRNVIAIHCKTPKAHPRRSLDFGLMDILPQHDCRLPKILAHWPLLDTFFRDTSICNASDGNYYLTGTTGDWGKEGIHLYKSTDLSNWDDIGLVWTPEKNATWQMRGRKRESFKIWAPEIHYLKGTFWIPYCTSYAESPNIVTGTGLLKSTSGKAEGPYMDMSPDGPMTEGLDASLFQDDDGAVYFLHGGNRIARMKDDMSGLAEKSRDLHSDNGGVGYEGIFMFKHDGKYYWSATANGLPDRDYDCFVAVADKIEGPYRNRQMAVSHGGHNMFFKDKKGQWWSTIFGGDAYAPFIHRPGIIPIEFAPDGTIHPVMDGSR